MVLSCRERRDFEGRVAWEKGIVGEARLADVLEAPFGAATNAVSGGCLESLAVSFAGHGSCSAIHVVTHSERTVSSYMPP